MKPSFALPRISLLLVLALPGFCWGFPARTALIVDDGSGFDVGTVGTFLSGRLVSAGFAVTTNTGVPSGSLASYSQVWDIRFENATPLTNSDITAYVAYLASGGSLFVMGENTGFITRDNSIIPLIAAAGGGTVTIDQTNNSLNLQTVNAPFTGPVSLPTVTFAAIGSFLTFGNGRAVSHDANGAAGGLVFPPGALTNAPLGTLITVLDVNFLTASTGGSQALTDNLIAYLAAPVQINPLTPTPAPPTMLLVLAGLAGAGLFAARRRFHTA